ncbi:MAG: flagellar hook-length control protein FliK [Thermodesulfovibrio sp.]
MQNQILNLDQSLRFDDIFNELLKLLFENQELSNNDLIDKTLFVFPISSLNSLLMQDIKILQNIPQAIEIPSQLKTVFLFGQGNIDTIVLEDISKNLKSQSNKNEVHSFFEAFGEKDSTSVESFYKKELVNILKTENNPIIEKIKLGLNPESSTQSESLTFTIVNNLEKQSFNLKSTNTMEKAINQRDFLTEMNPNNFQFQSHDISNTQQKIELPFSQIKEVSDIVFKAISSSQKTIIIQLEPPELGKILIKLSMDNSGVKADMKVDYPHVKEILMNLIPEIRNNLQSLGIKVSDFLLDLTKEPRSYSDSYSGQGQRKYKGNQKFFEYFV